MKFIKQSFEILTPISRELILENIERYARVCHKSEHKMNTENNSFVIKLLNLGHDSILEHEKLSVRFVTDRGVSHELVRHRLASYLQQSTRYCDSSNMEIVVPSWFNDDKWDNQEDILVWKETMETIENAYRRLISLGWSKDKARSILPNSLKTEIIVTANLREWRHILKLRTSSGAHEQIRNLLAPLQNYLREILPEIF